MTQRANNTELSEVTGADMAAIHEALDDLVLDEMECSDTAVEEEVLADLDILDQGEEQALELHIAKSEVYDEQEASEIVVEAPAAAAKVKKAKVAKAAKAPSPTRDPNMLPESAFMLDPSSTVDPVANKAAVLASRPTQKKIAEKFDNLLTALAAGRAPSIYVIDCFRVLDTNEIVTSSELVAALKATAKKGSTDTYSDGTARSQVGQCMELFAVLKIANRAKSTLALNADSLLAVELRKFI